MRPFTSLFLALLMIVGCSLGKPSYPYYSVEEIAGGVKVKVHFTEDSVAMQSISTSGSSMDGSVKVNAAIADVPPQQGFEIKYTTSVDAVTVKSVRLYDGTILRRYEPPDNG